MPPVDLAATNGAATGGPPNARSNRRRFVIAGALLFVAAWTVALVYSVTAGGRSPERLDDAMARTVEHTCRDTQRTLEQLPQIGIRATVADRATRVADENTALSAMVDDLRKLHPKPATPAKALTGWLDDWTRLIAAREHFVTDLRTKGDPARFVEPATKGVEPIAQKMNDWILEQGTRTNSCNTGVLQVEVVEGPRTYGPESES